MKQMLDISDRLLLRRVREHIEVFLDGVFLFSADTQSEAMDELAEYYGIGGGDE